MAEVLSQNEIDALLAAVSTGDVKTEEPRAGGEKNYINYDLTTQEKTVRGRLVGLDGIHDRFSRNLRGSLSNLLKKNVAVKTTPTEYHRFGDYLSNILLPASLNVIELPDLRGHILMVATSKLTYAIVDAYFGGSERPFSKIGGREQFTVIENNMIKKLTDVAVKDLEDAWRLNYPVKMKFQRAETNPQFIGCIHASEMIAVANFEIEFDALSGPLSLIIQLRPLEPIHASLAINMTELNQGKEGEWNLHWKEELLKLDLNCQVELGSTNRFLKDVQHWKKGDVIPLHQDASTPLDFIVEGLPKFRGLLGTLRGNHALSLTESVGGAPLTEKEN